MARPKKTTGRTFTLLRAYRGGRDLEEWEARERKRMETRPAAAPATAPLAEQTIIPGTEHMIGKKKRTR